CWTSSANGNRCISIIRVSCKKPRSMRLRFKLSTELLDGRSEFRGGLFLSFDQIFVRQAVAFVLGRHFLYPYRTQFFDGFLRTQIIGADMEQNAADELERVIEHQHFHGA